MRAYRLLPEVLVRPVAWGLPFLELALAVLLLAGIANRIAGAASAGLLVVFMLGIASAWARGLQIDCGCFSAGGPDASAGTTRYLGELLRDGGLLVCAYLVWRAPEPPGPGPRARPEHRHGRSMSNRRTTTTPRTRTKTTRPGSKPPARRQRRSIPAGWVVGISIQALRDSSTGELAVPAHALGPANGEVFGQASAPVTVEEFGDFQCPNCAAFEATVGPTIRRLVDQGKIRFVYHPMAFLGPESVAAANAATFAGDQGKFWPYHDLLFSQQAAENSGFLSTDQLLRFGERVGASDSRFTGCVKDDTYVPWVHQVTDEASQRGVNATPAILVNGRVEPAATTVQGLLAAVAAASR